MKDVKMNLEILANFSMDHKNIIICPTQVSIQISGNKLEKNY